MFRNYLKQSGKHIAVATVLASYAGFDSKGIPALQFEIWRLPRWITSYLAAWIALFIISNSIEYVIKRLRDKRYK